MFLFLMFFWFGLHAVSQSSDWKPRKQDRGCCLHVPISLLVTSRPRPARVTNVPHEATIFCSSLIKSDSINLAAHWEATVRHQKRNNSFCLFLTFLSLHWIKHCSVSHFNYTPFVSLLWTKHLSCLCSELNTFLSLLWTKHLSVSALN